jgi:hypothetical protein
LKAGDVLFGGGYDGDNVVGCIASIALEEV